MKFLAVAFAFILFVQLADVRVDNFSSFFFAEIPLEATCWWLRQTRTD